MASDLAKTPIYRHTMQRLEEVKRVNSQGDDFWLAREIHGIFGYPTWDKFVPVIEKAAQSITSTGGDPSHHIAQTSKLMELGKGAKKRGVEYFLSRGACYLIAMNGDVTKPEIAGAQHYFAVQTRFAEIDQKSVADRKRLDLREDVKRAVKRVTDVAKDAGVTRFALFHHARNKGLYGMSTKELAAHKGLRDGENLFERAGSLELSANEFQMQLAASKIVNEGILGEEASIKANFTVAKEVRSTVQKQSGTDLADIPLEPDSISDVRKREKIRQQKRIKSRSVKITK